MSLRNPAPFVRRRMSMTPLIDVIFLLLLFFMLSSTFSSFAELELTQAQAGPAGAEAAGAPRLFLQLGETRLLLNGAPVTLEDLAARELAGQLLVSLDADASAQRLVDLLVRLRGRAGLSVTVLEPGP